MREDDGVVDATLYGDMVALRRTARENVPALDALVAAARTRGVRTAGQRRSTLLLRVGLATAAAACLLAVPVRFERTTGSVVRLTVAGPGTMDVRVLGAEFARALDGASAGPARMSSAGHELCVLVPDRDAATAARRASAFAGVLAARGITARVTVSSRSEWTWGPLAALARERILRLRLDHRQAPLAIERDLRAQLRAQGIADPEVSVTPGPSSLVIRFAGPMPPIAPGDVDLQLSKPGARVSRVHIPNSRGRSDEELRLEMERLLHDHGFDAHVEVRNGRIVSIRPPSHP